MNKKFLQRLLLSAVIVVFAPPPSKANRCDVCIDGCRIVKGILMCTPGTTDSCLRSCINTANCEQERIEAILKNWGC